MDTSSFFRKSHAYLHVSLACCSTKSWPTPVLLPAVPCWTSCECLVQEGHSEIRQVNNSRACSDMRLRNRSARVTTMSILWAQQKAVHSTCCLPNRNGGASCASCLLLSLCSVKSLFGKVSLPVDFGSSLRAAWCIYPTSTIHFSFS